MAEIARQGELFPSLKPPEGTVVINDRCLIRTQEGHRLVIVSGIVLSQYALGDHMAEAYAMVSLVEQGWADQIEVARAFSYSERTMRRHQRRFEDGGLSALGQGSGYPKGRRRLKGSRTRLIHRLKSEGQSNREIARRLGVHENAVRKLLRRLGWKKEGPDQKLLPIELINVAHPNLSASPASHHGEPSEEAPSMRTQTCPLFHPKGKSRSHSPSDTDPANRVSTGPWLTWGSWTDAAPLFRPGTECPRGRSPACATGYRPERHAAVRPQGLRQHRSGVLWTSHEHRRPDLHGAPADQASRRSKGAAARRPRPRSGPRSRARGQDPTAKA